MPKAPSYPPVSTTLSKNIPALPHTSIWLSEHLARKQAEISKKKLLDSGANISIVSSLTHLDPNTNPLFHSADKPLRNVETANNSKMPIQGQGKFEGVNGVLCETATNSLLSLSQYT